MPARKADPPRCDWSLGVHDDYLAYHDHEWGVPQHDEGRHFEFLVLETSQAGLNWRTILCKREGYRQAFAGFDPVQVAAFDQAMVETLLTNPAIIRNRRKVEATIKNARAFLNIQKAFGSFDAYIWGFVEGRAVVNAWQDHKDIPVTTPLSDAVSKDMKQRGFGFVGSTTIYAHLQAIGVVNDHLVRCFRYRECM